MLIIIISNYSATNTTDSSAAAVESTERCFFIGKIRSCIVKVSIGNTHTHTHTHTHPNLPKADLGRGFWRTAIYFAPFFNVMFQLWLWSGRVKTVLVLHVIFPVECATAGAWLVRPHGQAGRELEALQFLQFCYLLYVACSTFVEFEHVTHSWCPFYVSGNIIPFSFFGAGKQYVYLHAVPSGADHWSTFTSCLGLELCRAH